MNAIMNETQFWCCDICEKTNNFKSKLRHINSKTHKNNQNFGIVVKEYEFIKFDINEVNYILNDIIKGCRNNFFISFEHRCVYDIKLTNMENN